MSTTLRSVAVLVVGVLLLLTTGCGGGESNPATVTGKVTLSGQPLTLGRVIFEKEGQTYIGVIDPEGNYELKQSSAVEGAAPGPYRVAVIAEENVPMGQPVKSLIPAKYNNTATSGLTATVTEGDNEVNFDLSP